MTRLSTSTSERKVSEGSIENGEVAPCSTPSFTNFHIFQVWPALFAGKGVLSQLTSPALESSTLSLNKVDQFSISINRFQSLNRFQTPVLLLITYDFVTDFTTRFYQNSPTNFLRNPTSPLTFTALGIQSILKASPTFISSSPTKLSARYLLSTFLSHVDNETEFQYVEV